MANYGSLGKVFVQCAQRHHAKKVEKWRKIIYYRVYFQTFAKFLRYHTASFDKRNN